MDVGCGCGLAVWLLVALAVIFFGLVTGPVPIAAGIAMIQSGDCSVFRVHVVSS